ncbi:unnamed protein product [Plutella xylostella]|uniref:(diamondback moth) hypothetical protein n=1 Tax=Plutella xylostella TaxID=51655 RepID=A0A8S4FU12_PLUXY|nr:unnamed protein product [Plutella xylostella]
MTFRLNSDWRTRRNQFGSVSPNYAPMHYSIASYCTETKADGMNKADLNELFTPDVCLSQLHMLPNPLQKNLADTLPAPEVEPPSFKMRNPPISHENLTRSTESMKIEGEVHEAHALSSIGNFISGVFSVLSAAIPAMPFQRRPKPHSCDQKGLNSNSRDAPPSPLDFWPSANTEQQNKNNCRDQLNTQSCENNINAETKEKEMSVDVRAAAAHCEAKINKVRSLLSTSKTERVSPRSSIRQRPKKVFVEPSSVNEHYEEVTLQDDFIHLPNDASIECISTCKITNSELMQIDATKIKTEMAPLETMDIIKPLKDISITEDKTVKDVLPNGSVQVQNLEAKKNLLNGTAKIENKDTSKILCNGTSHIKSITKTNTPLTNGTKKLEKIDELQASKSDTDVDSKDVVDKLIDTKTEIIQSCEDKLSRLKALLSERRKNNTKSCLNTETNNVEPIKDTKCDTPMAKPIPVPKVQNKRYKNPNRLNVDKRKQCQLRRNIKDDMTFADEINVEPSSVENSPQIHISTHFASNLDKPANPSVDISKSPASESTENLSSSSDCFFNEIAGRFHKNSTTESEDSFQIVFADSPQHSPRTRKVSDCDSEDSFIIFEDSPDSCYTSTDVFGHHSDAGSESDSSAYDSDIDSGRATFKLSHSLSRTISDLTDDSLYEDSVNTVSKPRPYSDSEDEVDCAVKICDEIPDKDLDHSVKVGEVSASDQSTGLLLDDAKKIEKKKKPVKKVTFSTDPPKVRVMRVWAYAARQARAGHWEKHAVDRERFKRRIADVDMAISWVLKPQHRARVKFQRFMPWWHAERRREIAEKKQRDEEEKIRAERERIRAEEEAEQERIWAEQEAIRLEQERVAAEEKRKKEEEARRIEEEKKRVVEEKKKQYEAKLGKREFSSKVLAPKRLIVRLSRSSVISKFEANCAPKPLKAEVTHKDKDTGKTATKVDAKPAPVTKNGFVQSYD